MLCPYKRFSLIIILVKDKKVLVEGSCSAADIHVCKNIPISLINIGSDWKLHFRYVLFTMTSNIPLVFILDLLKQKLEREVPTYGN